MESRDLPDAYRFGDYVFDPTAFRVTRGDVPVHLEPKAVDVLRYLIDRPGLLVSKHELIHAIWKDTAVGDNALTRLVAQLRKALEDPADRPRYIETVPTRGYRFIAHPVPTRPGPTREETLASAISPRRTAFRGLMPTVAVLIVAGSVAAFVALTQRRATVDPPLAGAPPAAHRARIAAVLPFKNLSGDPEQGYVADGVTQAVTDTLSQLDALTVISTTSSRKYRDTTLASTAIAAELGVDALFEGAVIRSGNRLRVSVAMVDGPSGQRLWTRSYERDMVDVLAIYDDIASSLAADTTLIVGGRGTTHPGRARPVDPVAYDDYLRGMYFLGNRWLAGGCGHAEPLLLRTVGRDPEFAPAYAALAWCYAYPDRLGRDIADVGPKARAAVARSLALDDQLSLAHAVAGTIAWRVDYDLAGAERELRRAFELDPTASLVLVPVAEFDLWCGDGGRGLALLDRALALDPFSPDRHTQVAFSLIMVGRYEAATAVLHRSLELDPHYLVAQMWLAEAHGYLGQRDTAVAEYLKWLDGALRPKHAAKARTVLQQAYSTGGWAAFWSAELHFAEEENSDQGTVWVQPYTRFAGPWFMARRYARLGEWDRALDALDRAYAARHHLMATLPLDPLFVPLHSRERFRELLRKTGARLQQPPPESARTASPTTSPK